MALPVILAIAAGAVAAGSQMKASKAEEIELKMQAEQEKLAAQGRELERRERLNKILSQSVASQAASGVEVEGTPESIALDTAKKASLSEGLESLSDRLRESQLKRKAANVKEAGKMAAASTLIKTGASFGQAS